MARKLTETVELVTRAQGTGAGDFEFAERPGGGHAVVIGAAARPGQAASPMLQFYDAQGQADGDPISLPTWATGVVRVGDGFLVFGPEGIDTGEGDLPAITGRLYSAEGQATGGEFLISDSPDDYLGPPFALTLPDGSAVVVWYQEDLQAIRARFVSSNGDVSEIRTLLRGDEYVVRGLEPSAGGGFIVDYLYDRGFEAEFQTFTAEGEPVGPPNTGELAPVRADFDDGGYVLITIRAGVLIGQEFNADGSRRTDEFKIDDATGNHSDPSVRINDDGTYSVVWTEIATGDFGREIGRTLYTRLIETFTRDAAATTGDDDLSGGAGLDTLAGLGGSDVLFGFGGDDTLDGGAGADMMYGGDGNDVYIVDHLDDEVGEFQGRGLDTVYASVDFALDAQIEDLFLVGSGDVSATGNDLENRLIGNGGANTLIGGGGVDDMRGEGGDDILDGRGDNVLDGMRGGLGNDVYFAEDTSQGGPDFVIEAGGEGFDTVYYSAAHPGARIYARIAPNVERALLTGVGTLSGDERSNRLVGSAGDDVIDGQDGADQMRGAEGFDTYHVDDVDDRIYDDGGRVIATVEFRLENTPFDDLTVIGQADLKLAGNEKNNRLIGNFGDNVLFGGGGQDTMSGEFGNDTYYVDDVNDRVFEYSGRGYDLVWSTVSFNLSGQYIEKLALFGDGDIDATGNSLNNIIRGNNGDNVIDGGRGVDAVRGLKGDDTYYVDHARDVVTELNGEGLDSIFSEVSFGLAGTYVENLTLTGLGDLNATGNSLENLLTGNGGANVLDGGRNHDRLVGGFGKDTLIGGTGDDVLNGGFGADMLDGGAGADRFVFTSIVESTLDETDMIEALGEGDRIDLSAIDADGLDDGDDAFELVALFSNERGQARLEHNAETGRTTLLLDVDGDGMADAQIWIMGAVENLDTGLF